MTDQRNDSSQVSNFPGISYGSTGHTEVVATAQKFYTTLNARSFLYNSQADQHPKESPPSCC